MVHTPTLGDVDEGKSAGGKVMDEYSEYSIPKSEDDQEPN
jgi:hypothetical protein